MKLSTRAACVGVVLGLSGCMSTYHAERHYVAGTAIDSAGSVSSFQDAKQDERAWHGPWLGQPSHSQP